METTERERIEQEYQRKLAELGAKESLLASLPAALPRPDRVHIGKPFTPPWIIYRVETVAEALAIVNAYGPCRDVSAIPDGCLSVAPVDSHPAQYRGKPERWTVTDCVILQQSGGRVFFVAELEFWPASAPVKVNIEIKQLPYRWRCRQHCNYNRSGDVTRAEFRDPDAVADGLHSETVKYAGGSPDAFHYSVIFTRDALAEALSEVVS